jgi:glycosyltransferase involved in cell wall biosynthesis
MDEYPVISVVIPTRNRVHTLKRMLDKLFAENYPNLEVIIVDGASTDGTIDLIKSYGSKISRWVSERDNGEYFALNKGIPMATGEIIKMMSDDDVMHPGSYHKAARYFASHPNTDILFGQTNVWEETDGTKRRVHETMMTDPSRLTLRNWLRGHQVIMSISSFIHRRVFNRIGLLSTEYVCGDVEFWVRAATKGIVMDVVDDVFLDYYITGSNGVITKKWQVAHGMVRINARYGTLTDILYSLWKGYVKPFTYRPVVNVIRRICRMFGFDPGVIVARRRGVKI